MKFLAYSIKSRDDFGEEVCHPESEDELKQLIDAWLKSDDYLLTVEKIDE